MHQLCYELYVTEEIAGAGQRRYMCALTSEGTQTAGIG